MKMILATNNQDKVWEVREILSGMDIEIVSQREAGCDFEAEETGHTFAENALIKARAALEATGLPAMADDSGLEIDALGSCPGIYSSRFLGELSYPEKCHKIIGLLDGLRDRGARYVCAAAAVYPDGTVLQALGTTEGEIASFTRGTGGFGYDPMFWLPERGKTMAELTDEEKNAISHRGRAFRRLAELMSMLPPEKD